MMPMQYTFLYTYALQGDLALLPRLHTFIQATRRDLPQPVYLLDLGRSCVPDAWPCDVTQGRSTLLVLDAMGYAAANVTDTLTPDSRRKLTGQVMLALIDPDNPHESDTLRFVSDPSTNPDDKLTVVLTPGDDARLDRRVLTLAPVDKGQVGLVQIAGDRMTHEIRTMPDTTHIDATIQGAVDFVKSEARFFEKRRGNQNGDHR